MTSDTEKTTEKPVLRIFISSPGDVNAERVIAERVIKRLTEDFALRVGLEPIFWEHEPMRMTDTFQTQIPPPSEADIFICILWSRIGTRLPAKITRADGSRYESGTEYEFEDAWSGFDDNGKPDILVYRKTVPPPFLLKPDAPDYLDKLKQKELLETFFRKWFQDEEGSFVRAFNPFDDLAQFEERLESHLYKILEDRFPPTQEDLQRRRLTWTQGSPFRGLKEFEEQHAPVYFGRTRAIGEVLNALRKQEQEQRPFVMVLGMSGSGKTSLLKAGVLPLLTQAGVIEGVAAWHQVILQPLELDSDLSAWLAKGLLSEHGLPIRRVNDMSTLIDHMRRLEFDALIDFIARRLELAAREQNLEKGQNRLLLVIDQMEKLFTHETVSAQERIEFGKILSALIHSGYVWGMATFRSDFYYRCAEVPALLELIEGNGQYMLIPPGASELSQIIRLPALAAGLTYEEHPTTHRPLDEVFLDAMVDMPENLALLEFTLEMLYQHRTKDNVLTYAAYEGMGGLEGALAQWAEEVFHRLSPTAQTAFPKLMRTLVTLEKTGKRPVSGRRILSDGTDVDPAIREILEYFIKAHLVVTDRSEDGLAFARIAHDTLLIHWPRLQEWLEEDRNLLRVRAWINDAAMHWDNEGRLPGMLIPEGRPLQDAELLKKEWPDAIREPAVSFINISLQAAEERRLEMEREARHKLRRVKRLAAVFAGISVIAVLAGLFGYQQARLADKRAIQAGLAQKKAEEALVQMEKSEKKALLAQRISEQLSMARTSNLFESRISNAALLGRSENYVEAWKVLDQAGTLAEKVPLHRRHVFNLLNWYSHLLGATEEQLYAGMNGAVLDVDISHDGRTLVAGGENGELKLFDTRSGKVLQNLQKHSGDITAVCFHPRNNWFVSGGHDKRIVLWAPPADSEDGYQAVMEWPMTSRINALAFSPNGKYLASGGRDKLVKLWRSGTESVRTFSGHWGRIAQGGLAFSPDSRLLASVAYDDTGQVWDIESGKRVKVLKGHAADLESVAFSADSQSIATGSSDKTIRLWEVNSERTPQLLYGHKNSVFSLHFTADGHLVSAGRDRTLRLWDAESGTTLRVFQGHSAGVRNLAVYKKEAFSAGYDGTLRRWNVALPQTQQIIKTGGSPSAVALAPDGQTIALGFEDGLLRLYQPDGAQILFEQKAHTGRIARLQFNHAGTLLASAGSGDSKETVKLWTYQKQNLELQHAFSGEQSGVHSLDFSPDDSTLARAGYDGKIRLYHFADDTETVFDAHHSTVYSLDFSPNGKQLLSTGKDNQILLWDISKQPQELIKSFNDSLGDIQHAAFSPDGKWISVGGRSGVADVYESEAGYVKYRLVGHENALMQSIFSPDSEQLATVSADATIKFWDLHSGQELLNLDLPTQGGWPVPLWRFDFACDSNEICRIAVPLARGKLVLYEMGKIY